ILERESPMRIACLLPAIAWLAMCPDSALAADLSKIDRAIAKEPIYQSKSPKYCLLVFGPDAKFRVWLVHDGNVLFVDRNGNGDLTDQGERVEGTEYQKRWWNFNAGDVLGADGKPRYKSLTVRFDNNLRYGMYLPLAIGKS